MATLLISYNDIRDFNPLSGNINFNKEVNSFILDAQEYDLRNFLGDNLYLSLLADFEGHPSLQIYEDLFNGSTYEISGCKYKHEGVKSILINHAYARYLAHSNMTHTATGMVTKLNQYSDPISSKELTRLIEQARAKAAACEQRVERFLCDKSNDYPLWADFRIKKTKYKNGIKLKIVG